MDSWEEIKRLAADFQRAQTNDTLQKLSERNCIDIVKKLAELKLLDFIYTCDGKEIITSDHLLTEIKDEVHFNGGRVHLSDLASKLNVDYQHIENKVKELYSEEYNLILGQIIHESYKKTLEKQIYDAMTNTGQLSVADFAKSLDLPAEFLLNLAKEILVDEYVASPDGRTYYTLDMMDRYKSIVAGALSAITKPTSLAMINRKLDMPEKLFNIIVDGLLKTGRIDATIENRLIIPSVYIRKQNEWVDQFYASNLYVDYDVLARQEIKQPKVFLKKRFPEGIQLKHCFVSPNLLSQVESMVEDCVTSNGLIDITTMLPASLQSDDIELMLKILLEKNEEFSTNCFLLNKTSICSQSFLDTFDKTPDIVVFDETNEHLKQELIEHIQRTKTPEPPPPPTPPPPPPPPPPPASEQADQENLEADQTIGVGEDGAPKANPEAAERVVVKPLPMKPKLEEIELTPEDIKRERRLKKNKHHRAEEFTLDDELSDDKQSGKKSKNASARKSGAGPHGREFKQKATKKKYVPGKKSASSTCQAADSESE